MVKLVDLIVRYNLFIGYIDVKRLFNNFRVRIIVFILIFLVFFCENRLIYILLF